MYVPLKITTDYTLLKSMIKIDDIISKALEKQINSLAIVDENLYGVMEFYNKCLKNKIKPIVGLDVTINNMHIFLYAKNYNGYQNLLKIHTIKYDREPSFIELSMYNKDILVIIPFEAISLYEEIAKIYELTFIGYASDYEKTNALLITKNIVYVNNIRALKKEDTLYLDYLDMILKDEKISIHQKGNYEKNYYLENISLEDEQTTLEFASLINFEIPVNENYIPLYNKDIKESFPILENLTFKGLNKRLKGNIPLEYKSRLEYELKVIKTMGFVDYILIVYDYVLFAKKNNIFVGPGRGSAAGSLVCYTLGITDIDPIKYNLLFERFLNPERVTMPDIDIDFENTKRYLVVDYIKKRYGLDKVASILAFATLKSKLALRETTRILELAGKDIDNLLNEINPNKTLRENLENGKVKEMVMHNKEIQKIYKIALKIEGFKKNISTHAAGVVISRVNLEEIIPIINVNDGILTGITKEYLEDLGLLKMDLLAVKNLTIIANILELIKNDTGKTVNLNKIDLEGQDVINCFKKADTTGIFQFESEGMRNFLLKLNPRNFSDLIASLALFRPGPMDNIDEFIKRKEGKKKVTYLLPILEPILKETEGIIVYQEQVMQILVNVASYSYAEADIIRRAMSKKKKDVIENEFNKFIVKAEKNGYDKKISEEIYNLIIKFAGYGFNKSHSVSYALIGYQMAYLKVKFPKYFITNLLNMSIGSVIKTKEYLNEAKIHNLKLIRPSINLSTDYYKINNNELILPLSIIKGLSSNIIESIIKEREENGVFTSFQDFAKRMIDKHINERIMEILIIAGVFEEFGNMTTLKENLAVVLNYAELSLKVDLPLQLAPILKEYEDVEIKNKRELDSFGFYITNHPASVYQDKSIMKLKNIMAFFDKYIRCIVLIENIKKTKTKNNDDMAFMEASDETGSSSFVIFKKQISLLSDLKVGDIVLIEGRVTKRFDKYQINVNNITKK